MSGLGKLIKYEFMSIGRIMMPLYGAFMLVSVLLGISLMLSAAGSADVLAEEGLGTSLLKTVSVILYVLVAGAVFVVTTVLLIQRYYRNLLGCEGYLCFTLPVGTGVHIANKTISAAIWMALGALAGTVSAFIILSFFVTPGEMFGEIGRIIEEISAYGGFAKSVLVVAEMIILSLLACGETAIKIYAAISLGQMWTRHRILGALAAFIGFGICEGILMNIVGAILPPDAMCLYNSSGLLTVQSFFLGIFMSTVLLGAVYWFITHRTLDRHLNLQ